MGDHKTVATILFRVLGVAYIVFAVLYWPYNLLMCYATASSSTVIGPTLYSLVYIALGLFLIILSKRLAALVVKGLDRI
jgi:hypothetical protein